MQKLNNISLFFMTLFSLVSCTIESPDFVIKGMQTKEAILFLQEFQKRKKSAGQFNHHIKYLRTNHAPGFAWDEYWSEIKEKKLYKNLNVRQLDQLLSLSDISCRQESESSFAELLLKIAESDSKALLFSQQLARLRETCFGGLPHFTFRFIVQFLSDKRAETEVGKIKEAKYQLEIQKQKQIESVQKRYIYTEELQRLLIDEWSAKQNTRIWSDILSVVDRSFWSDARWINYQNKNREYLKRTLKMEWIEYQSIKDLDQDVFLMFKESNKMADIIRLVEYKKYFAISGILDWSSLWNSFLIRYPEKPENGNIESLLSLYSFSCQKQDLSSYSQLVELWNVSSYNFLAVEFCVDVILADVHKKSLMKKISKKGDTSESSSFLGYETLEVLFKNNLGPMTLQSLDALLFLYEKDKHVRSSDQWKKLIDYFSEEDWLNVMRILRNRYDRRSISRILDMHNQVYKGWISFLTKDILAVFISEKGSVLDIVDKYGYRKAYLNNPRVLRLFWKELENIIEQKEVVDLQKQNDAGRCDYSYLSNLFQFFSYHNKKRLLFSNFSFENCSYFIEEFRQQEWTKLVNLTEHISVVDGEVQFTILDMELDIKHSSDTEIVFHFVWWLAGVLSLHLSPLDSRLYGNDNLDLEDLSLKEVISKISVSRWENIIRVILQSLKEPVFKVNTDLFNDIIYKLNFVYPQVVNRSICYFFGQKDSHFLIQEYDPKFVIALLENLDWSELKLHDAIKMRGRNLTMKRTCSNIVSYKRVNTLLFVMAHSIFEAIDPAMKIKSHREYVDRFWNQAYKKMVNLFAHIGRFDQKWNAYFDLRRVFRFTVFDYDPKIGYMNNSSFHFYFAALVLQKFQGVAHTKKDIGDLLNVFFNTNPPLNVFDQNYREWMKMFLKNLKIGEKAGWEEKLDKLKEELNL